MAAADAAGGDVKLRTGSIGLLDVVFQSITYMAPGIGLAFSIGIGIGYSGTTLPLSVVIALIACTFAAVAIGQTAKYLPSAGGIYTYAAKGLHPTFGFIVGWFYLGFAAFLPPFVFLLNGWLIDTTLKDRGWWTGSPGWEFWTAVTIVAIFFLTYFDVRLSAKAGIILGVMEIAVMVALSATIIGEGPNKVAPFDPSNSADGTKGLMLGAVFGILAFIGFEAASALGEEARDPRRTVPRGVLYSCVAIGLYYVFCVYAWNVGSGFNIVQFHTDTGGNDWIAMAQDYWSSGWVIVFLALVNSNIACGAAAVNNAGRVLFAMGRVGALPSIVGKVHSHHRTPHIGVIVTLVLSTITSYAAGSNWDPVIGFTILGGGFTILAILIYMIACAACIGFFMKPEGRPHRNVFLHVVIPILGLISFILPLYGQYFSFDSVFKWTLTTFPGTWYGWGAIVWIVLGLGVTAFMAQTRPQALEDASRAFGGEDVGAEALA